MNLDDD